MNILGFVRKGLRIALTYSVGRERCLCCGRETFDMPLCSPCLDGRVRNFPPPGDARCSRCGKVLLSERGTCTACRTKAVIKTPDSVFPLHSYRLWHKKLLSEWKLHGHRALSPLFASLFADALRKLGMKPEDSFIVPVPPRPGKIRREGWDQIIELALILRSSYGYDFFPLLKRISTSQQKEKNRKERVEGSGSSYSPTEAAESLAAKNGLMEKNAVLIDDVITTGATIEECSVRLKELGLRKVHVLSIFIVD